MKVFAAMTINTPAMQMLSESNYPNVLVSFAYKNALDKLMRHHPEHLMLDSGAFTAWSKGKQVDVYEYRDWALEKQAEYPNLVAVNLDVIPGSFGRTSTKAERLKGMRDSIKNADFLRDAGLNVTEVFHMDEPRQFLDDLLDRLPEGGVLCISPRNDKSVKARAAWQRVVLAHMMQRFTKKTFPKCHGLAVTSSTLLKQFPYYSGDSSSWLTAYTYGTYINENGVAEKLGKDLLPTSVGLKDGRSALNFATIRSLNNLRKLEADMTALWEKRGVKF